MKFHSKYKNYYIPIEVKKHLTIFTTKKLLNFQCYVASSAVGTARDVFFKCFLGFIKKSAK